MQLLAILSMIAGATPAFWGVDWICLLYTSRCVYETAVASEIFYSARFTFIHLGSAHRTEHLAWQRMLLSVLAAAWSAPRFLYFLCSFPKLIIYYCPVSYTQLDVYKRQVTGTPSGQLIVAGYDQDGRIIKTDVIDGYTAELTEYSDCRTIRAFLWNNIEDMQPVCESQSVTLE